MSSSSYVSNLQAVLMSPWDKMLSPFTWPVSLGGLAVGYYFWAPLIGASESVSIALASLAFARSFVKIAIGENSAYLSAGGKLSSTMASALAYGVLPLGAMYLSAQVMPLVDISGGLLAYAVYVAVAAATMSYNQS